MAKLIKDRWLWGIATIFSLLLMGYSVGYGQSSANYQIEVDVISGGGGQSTSANYVLSSVIGQSKSASPCRGGGVISVNRETNSIPAAFYCVYFSLCLRVTLSPRLPILFYLSPHHPINKFSTSAML